MSGGLKIRNVVVSGHRTSVRLHPVLWEALSDIAMGRGMSIHELATEIAQTPDALEGGLTVAIRVYIVRFYRQLASTPESKGK